ncbi:MAG: LysR family transcriptional regulator [Myxococcaceae bacterium]|nr:LysR family transcriptional regulator [Myxococcaceae bacterium]
MDYNHAAVFVQVVTSGGFSAAAKELGVPKSSVSRTVALLERELGVRLLQRTTRKVTPTEAGAAFFEAVKTPVGALEQAGALAREHGDAPRGLIRMTVAPEFGALPQTLTRFTRKHPGVQVEVSVASRFVDLVGEGFDLAIRAGKLEDSSLVARRIGAADLALLAAPAYLRRRGRPRTFEALDGHDWVLYRAANGRGTVQLQGPRGPRTLETTATLASDDLSFCRKAVIAGAGLGLLPVHTVVDDLRAGTLESVLPGWSQRGASVYVVLPSNRFVPTRVALLRDHLVETLSAQLQATERACASAREAPEVAALR